MADYIKATNFATKDTLSTGDPAKIVRGTEIDAEFSAIESAIESKADINSPTFTGIPTAPTPNVAIENTQIATTAYVANKLSSLPSGGVTSFSAGSTGLTPATATTGNVVLAGAVNPVHGGTGQTSYSAGDLLYATGASTLAKRSIGTTGQILTVVGGVPTWSTLTSGGKLVQRIVRRNTGSFMTTSTSYSEVTGWDGALSITVSSGSYILVTAYAATMLGSYSGVGLGYSEVGGRVAIRESTAVRSTAFFQNLVESDGAELCVVPSLTWKDGPKTAGTYTYNLALQKLTGDSVQLEPNMWFILEEYIV